MIPEKSYKPQGLKVALRNNKGSISLRYSYQGKQIDLSLGLQWDSVPNHQKAISIANQIHNDIYIFNSYDESKDKYRIKKKVATSKGFLKEITLKEAWEYYLKQKPNTDKRLAKMIDNAIIKQPSLRISEIGLLVESMQKKLANGSIISPLNLLRAGINMAIKHGLYKGENFLGAIVADLELPPEKQIKIFSKEEIDVVLSAFSNPIKLNKLNTKTHCYYYHLIKF